MITSFSRRRIRRRGSGVKSSSREAYRNTHFIGYRHDLILYSNEKERLSLLKRFLRKRFSAKNRTIMVNPWGCGRFKEYISEQFLIDEMKASGEIGADYYQIDDE